MAKRLTLKSTTYRTNNSSSTQSGAWQQVMSVLNFGFISWTKSIS